MHCVPCRVLNRQNASSFGCVRPLSWPEEGSTLRGDSYWYDVLNILIFQQQKKRRPVRICVKGKLGSATILYVD